MLSFKRCARTAGPGIITGAADNDPSGIATYSQAGAQFGYAQLWTALYLLPLQTAIQEACARIGLVTGQGLSATIKKYYGKNFLYLLVFLLFIANTINIGANIGAMAAAIQLIVPINFVVATFIFTLIILLAEIFFSYKRYANFLKWLCLSLIAYPITVFFIQAPWLKIIKATFIPNIAFNFEFLFILIGLFGTTISPYLFFWEASQEVEEKKLKQKVSNKKLISVMRVDNFLGMLFSQLGAWSIMVVTATVLNTRGLTNIEDAAEAAKALTPFLGKFAEATFALGIVGLGLLSIPILAGSVAYAASETFNWKQGLNLKFKNACPFYTVIMFATVLGLLINFIGINPMRALVYAAVINGIVALPLIFTIALITNNKSIMGRYKSKLWSNIFVWMAFVIMVFTVAAMLLGSLF